MVLGLADGLASRATPPAPPPPPSPEHLSRRALLVDDAPDVLVVIGAFLRSGGFDVLRAHDAEAALGILRGDEKLDVLVTDYAMPDMSGLELVALAGDLRPGLATVVITAFAADLARNAGRLPEMVVLAKPFARADLLAAVNRACAGAEARSARPGGAAPWTPAGVSGPLDPDTWRGVEEGG